MRKIVHISDLHFGTVDATVADKLIECVNALEPHLVVVSGDLTQRAKTAEFREAKHFLDRLPQPQLVVPGNHDVPLYNVYDRFVNALEKYERNITADLSPVVSDEELVVAGINTARSLTVKAGRISEEQVQSVVQLMNGFDERKLKVIVTHHPFDVPEGSDEDNIVGRAETALPLIAASGADVFLAGHLHKSHIGHSARRYKMDDGYSALIIQAGTATSNRERGEDNSFNVLEFEHPILTVSRYLCTISTEGFKLSGTEQFTHTIKGWARM